MQVARFVSGDVIAYGIVDPQAGELVALKSDPIFGSFDTTGARYKISEVKLLSPMIPRSKVVSLTGTFVAKTGKLPFTSLQLKPNTAVIGPDDPVVVPSFATEIESRGQLAVIIKRICKDLRVDDVPKVVFGYTGANSFSLPGLDPAFAAIAESFDTSCVLGPVVDFDLDPEKIGIASKLDGKEVARISTSELNSQVAEIISAVSTFFTLLPGDVILLGTGADPVRCTAGSQVELEFDELGVMQNPIVKR